ncbi:hypothetical protein [Treponema lecithinolyticum]|uniref:hypothetical protein n=1 Tax=Treponema lecithinolyticum TaxID=53418 RepID=UPI0028E7CB56|nr:hypothetical protein [Treponema lecithinolyticum]
MKNTFCASENGKNEVIANIEWTTGFLTDMPYLAYEYTGDVKYRALGRRQLGTFNHVLQQGKGIDEFCSWGDYY